MVKRVDVWSNLAVYVKRCDYSECRILFCYVPLLGVRLMDGEGSVGFMVGYQTGGHFGRRFI